jgi:ankyrin repeat protein
MLMQVMKTTLLSLLLLLLLVVTSPLVAAKTPNSKNCVELPNYSNIPRIPLGTLQQLEFDDLWTNQLELHNKPAIFVIDKNNTRWRKLVKSWSTKKFLKKFGSTLLHTITPFEVARFGPSSGDLSGRPKTLRQILSPEESNDNKNDDLMIFSNEKSRLTQLVLEKNSPATKWMDSQQQLPIDDAARPFISIARPGQGLPFHKHGPTYLTLVTGTKDWFIGPSNMRLSEHMLWTSKSSNYCFPKKSKLRKIRQNAGEIFFLPEGWWHATINSGKDASLGIVQNINVLSKQLDKQLENKRDDFHDGEPLDHQEKKHSRILGSKDDFLYDIPAFEAEESSHLEKLLLEADNLLVNSKLNHSEASSLRWTKRRYIWEAQLRRATKAYESSPKNARRPELCLYVVQVSVGSAADRIARESDAKVLEETKDENDNESKKEKRKKKEKEHDKIPKGLNITDVLKRIELCENDLTRASNDGYLGIAAYSASLIELSRAIRFTELEMVKLVASDRSLGFFVTDLKNEKIRLARKAVKIGEIDGKSFASVKSLWEAASLVCNHEKETRLQVHQIPDIIDNKTAEMEIEGILEECKNLLSSVLKESPSHMFALRLWNEMFQDDKDTNTKDMDTKHTSSIHLNGIDTKECNYKHLIELIHETHFDYIPVVFQSCLDTLSKEDKYKWLNVQDKTTGQTAIMTAALKGQTEIVKLLCKHVDLDLGESLGFLPIDGAAFSGHSNVLNVLISDPSCDRSSTSSNPNRFDIPSPVDGYTPIWRAVWGTTPSHSEAVKVLLEKGKVDPNTPCDSACPGPHETMLEYAVAINNAETVKILLDYGAKVSETVKNLVASRVSTVATCVVTQVDDCKHDPVATEFYERSLASYTNDDIAEEEDPEDDEDWLEEYEVNSDGDYWEEE